jgi:hypothetical protein
MTEQGGYRSRQESRQPPVELVRGTRSSGLANEIYLAFTARLYLMHELKVSASSATPGWTYLELQKLIRTVTFQSIKCRSSSYAFYYS